MYAIAFWLSGAAAIAAAIAQTSGPAAAPAGDPEVLYARREDPAAARQATAIWEARHRADPRSFEAAWKLARGRYWLGTHGADAERRVELERGIEAARAATGIEPKRPDGYFWLAANMGALAESFGMRQGMKYRRPIKDALETVLTLDPAYQQGSADRALGRWYFKVPGLFGGGNRESERHLRQSLTYNPHSTVSWFFLAETLLDMGREADARDALQRVLDAPFNPEWTPEDREWKQKATALLRTLGPANR